MNLIGGGGREFGLLVAHLYMSKNDNPKTIIIQLSATNSGLKW